MHLCSSSKNFEITMAVVHEAATPAQRLADELTIIKVGSGSLIKNDGSLCLTTFDTVARQISLLICRGKRCAIVTSGAISSGRVFLEATGNAEGSRRDRLCAAVGQGIILAAWQNALGRYELAGAQCLVTRDDLTNNGAALAERISELSSSGAVPILNADDGRGEGSTAEILRDNDRLAAFVAVVTSAARLILLSDVEGVKKDGLVIKEITAASDLSFLSFSQAGLVGKSTRGTGGIQSKIDSGLQAAKAGVKVLIAQASNPEVIMRFAGAQGFEGQFFKEQCFKEQGLQEQNMGTIISA